jgi:hypothetical protein
MQFPVTGTATAGYHVPGESVLLTGEGSDNSKYLSNIKHSERIIYIDNILQSSAMIYDLDEAKNHYEVRSIYSAEIGRALADAMDRHIVSTIIGGARKQEDRFGVTPGSAAAHWASPYLGSQIAISGTAAAGDEYDALGGTGDGGEIINGIYAAAELMDRKNVPTDMRYCVLPVAEYYNLLKSDEGRKFLNTDFQNAGNGNLANGMIRAVNGFNIFWSNHLPTVDRSALAPDAGGGTSHNGTVWTDESSPNNAVLNKPHDTANPAANTDGSYGADFSSTRGICFQSEGIGTVKLMDLSMRSDYVPDRLGTLMLAKYAAGHGVLREECCYELVEGSGS